MTSLPTFEFSSLRELLQYRASDVSGTAHNKVFTYLQNGEQVSASITFAELDAEARKIAAHLQKLTTPGDRVLLVYPPSMEYIVAFFGCVYAGVIAIPAVPPTSVRKRPRLMAIAEDAQPSAAIGPAGIAQRMVDSADQFDDVLSKVMWLTTEDLTDESADWIPVPAMSEDIVYLQYTSGSTGRPKGVMISNANVLANTSLLASTFSLGPSDSLVSWLPPHHDMGLVSKILLPVFVGCHCIQFPPAAFLMRPYRWLKAISDYRARFTAAPNFAYDLCVDKVTEEQKKTLDLSTLEFWLNGAEPVRAATLRRFAKAFAVCGLRPQTLIQGYGLAEATLLITTSFHKEESSRPSVFLASKHALASDLIEPAADMSDAVEMVSVGRPETCDDRVVIVNPDTRIACSDDRVGEIWICGPSVAPGYWGQPEASRDTFAAIAVGDDRKFLRTGDLGFIHKGNLHIAGRIKDMMIFNGRNVYPQDIEASIELIDPAFRTNGCAVFSIDVDGLAQMVIVQELESRKEPQLEGLAGKIRAELAEQHDIFNLAAIVLVKAGHVPRTSSGKIQRDRSRKLFTNDEFAAIWSWRHGQASSEKQPLRSWSGTERKLAEIWTRYLNIEQVHATDNFFTLLGGNSLLAAQITATLRDVFRVDIPLRTLFDAPTLAEFAERIDRAIIEQSEKLSASIAPTGATSNFPLSFSQQRLWFIDQFESAGAAYNISIHLHITGKLDVASLRRAVNEIVRRHAALRTSFALIHGAPVQVVAPTLGLDIPLDDLTGLSPEQCANRAEELARIEAEAAFDLTTGPLCRANLLRLDTTQHRLQITFHHTVFDGWSTKVLISEMGVLYAAFTQDQASPLSELKIQYPDYAVWQRQWLSGEVLQSQIQYWREQLLGAPPQLTLFTDRPRPAVQSFRGGSIRFSIAAETTSTLRALNRESGTSLFMVLAAIFNVLLSRYSGQDDICIGTVVANRNRAEIESLIGFFVNTLVLRTRVNVNASFETLLKQVRETALDAYEHQDAPFEQLVNALRPDRNAGHSPLFQVMLVLQNRTTGVANSSDVTFDVKELESATAKFDLTLEIAEVANELAARLEYNTDLFDAVTIARMSRHFTDLLEAAAADPSARIGDLPMMCVEERAQLLHQWNDTAVDYEKTATVHQLFEEQAAATPDNIALEFEAAQLSYAELNAKANQLAHYLREAGVGPDVLVGICLERSLDMVIALLAVLKAGGAYVPLDPAYPAERLAYMLADARPALVLTQQALRDLLPANDLPLLSLDAQVETLAGYSCANLTHKTLPSNLAYVIYTSGSTGKPKGTLLQHGGLCNMIAAQIAEFGVEPTDSILQFASFNFDASTWEIFMALMRGARLCLATQEQLMPGTILEHTLRRHSISIATLPPVVLGAMPENALPDLHTLVVAGEACSQMLVEQWGAGRRMFNAYGPTETTVCATMYACEKKRAFAPPIGKPINNTRIYLLDANLELVPHGAAGELYIAGDGLARGYLNRPALTAEKFVPNPYGTPGSRLYRSGDLARYLPDGNIEYLGRIDQQVKIRGFRIELGEIEAALLQVESLEQAVVLAREDIPGDKRLVAYLVARNQNQIPEADAMRTSLLPTLPDYMVPAHFVFIDSLPLTPNGKIDRKALPAPDMTRSENGYVAPRNATEATLAHIWADVLKLDKVSVHDNFFMLGGHSLLAVSLIERMRRANLHTDVRALFATPTIAALANASGMGGNDAVVPPNGIPTPCDRITPDMLTLVQLSVAEIAHIANTVPGGAANIQDIYPLAPLQEGILFHYRMQQEGDTYLLQTQLAFDSRERLDNFLAALQAVIARHDVFRTQMLWDGLAEPVQVVLRHASMMVEEADIGHVQAGADVARQLNDRYSPRHYRIDVREAPLLRGFIAEDSAHDRWLLQFFLHHLVSDHTTLEIIAEEIEAILKGRIDALPQAMPFRNFVAQTRVGISTADHEAFFRHMLADISEPTIPFGLLDVQADGSGIDESCHKVEAGLARRLRQCARQLGVSAASVIHLAWAQLLAAVSARQDVVFGTVLFGRMQGGVGADRALGLFINTLPLRIRIDDTGVADALRHTHALLSELMRHEHASLALAQRCSAVPAAAPLFSAMLNYRHGALVPDQTKSSNLWDGITLLGSEERNNYPFSLSVDDLGEGFMLTAQVSKAVEAKRVCTYMHTALEQLVTALESAPHSALRTIEILPAAEREVLLHQWNDTAIDYPKAATIQRLFEQQVATTPDNIALVFEEAQLTYAQLNAKANQLARYLRDTGVGPDVLVGICVARSLEMVIALLAVLKAGGAYVPLDPAYPEERLTYMIADAQPSIILTQQHLLAGAASEGKTLLSPQFCLDTQWQLLEKFSDKNLDDLALPDNLAYVIYTSGSTGKPKGAGIAHANLVNFVHTMQQRPGIDPGAILLSVTSLSFDIAALELFLPLMVGATTVLASRETAASPDLLIALLERSEATIMQATPSTWRMLVNHGWTQDKRELQVLCGGEALPVDLARQILLRSPVIWNMYGPTETTIWSAVCGITDVQHNPSIGRPIGNTQIYLLNAELDLAPTGVAGELYIAGDGLARGYLHRPDLTAEKFLPNPYGVPGSRMYRTGDLARYLEDGNITYLGRIDQQVKLRGFRIELGEIEATLLQFESLAQAVVIAREDVSGDTRLVAYMVARDPEHTMEAEVLRAGLLQSLPDYMIPAHFVFLDHLPLTPNGKIDRKAMPAPDMTRSEKNYVAPRTPTEHTLAGIWADVLKRDKIGIHDNFFMLGGHSLLATQVTTMIRSNFQIDIPLRTLFELSTLEELGAHVEYAGWLVNMTPDQAIKSEKALYQREEI